VVTGLLLVLTVAIIRPAAAEETEYPHGDFQGECSHCHGPDGWTPLQLHPSFDHGEFGFPLEGAHVQEACRSCHQDLDFTKTKSQCIDCHQDVHRGELGFDCAACHNTRSFTSRSDMIRQHQMTRLPLLGLHRVIDCDACHNAARGNLAFAPPVTCEGCHLPLFELTTDPDHVALGFPTDCAACHTEAGWGRARFDHSLTQFPLTGAHRAVGCEECHAGGVYAGTSTDCASCHQADYDATSNPAHGSAGFGADCVSCHSTAAWLGVSYQHQRFQRSGVHATLACSDCHGDGVYAGKDTACYSCHQSDYVGTTNPNHAQAGYSTDCTLCHGTSMWSGAVFDHNQTQFPLTGAHQALLCDDCHGDGVYAGKDTACYSCHQSDYVGTTNPNHAQAGYSTDCTLCHGTSTWTGATFDHDQTQFPLTGAHQALLCDDCHGDGVYAGKDTACYSCHATTFQMATNPDHVAAGFQTDCSDCHTTSTWAGAQYTHVSIPLVGAHSSLLCDDCHGDGVYAGRSTECVACHQADYDGTTNPNHAQAGYGTDCTLCHGMSTWIGATFDHDQTQFPLTGAHQALLCDDCHGDGVYAGKDTACYSCHQGDYAGTADPNHAQAGFSTDCTLCHGTSTWSGATFDHGQTLFPLTGAHLALICADCHGDGVYAGKDTACYSCHAAAFQTATNPDHVAAGFQTDCSACHTTSTWLGARYTHVNIPLSGAHTGLQCDDCHGDGVYAGKSTECIACHQADYDATTNPNHANLGFSTDCLLCHNMVTWQGATFDHDSQFFPIYSGAHQGRWNDCSDCHTNPTNYTVFSCLGCHPHSDQNKTDGDHTGVSGYSYDSQACYSCHPRGRS
jgi:hypothetical protein